jgi:VanZ family protein
MVFIFRGRMPAMVLMRSAWVLAMLVVTVLAMLPVEHLQLPVFDGWDKAQHVLAFAVLTAWALWIWPVSVPRVLLGMLAYGAGLELAQWAVGWRFAEWADLAADAVGVALAWVCVAWWRRRV